MRARKRFSKGKRASSSTSTKLPTLNLEIVSLLRDCELVTAVMAQMK
jgi:hypothetical protein